MNKSLILSVAGFLCFLMAVPAFAQEEGIASYYADGLVGLKMANGDRYDPEDLTCAHPTAPMGSIMKVARKDNPNQSVMVIVSDRGPYVKGRIIDLSKRAARELGLLEKGITDVVVGLIKKPGKH